MGLLLLLSFPESGTRFWMFVEAVVAGIAHAHAVGLEVDVLPFGAAAVEAAVHSGVARSPQ
jgi:hypothetical protein